MDLPPGYRFLPTDEELLCYYLRRRARNIPIPVVPPNMFTDNLPLLHNSFNPELLFRMRGLDREQVGYFFGFLGESGNNFASSVGAPNRSQWISIDRFEQQVRLSNGTLLGYKETFEFFEGNNRTVWIADLFTTADFDRIRLCKVYLNRPTIESDDELEAETDGDDADGGDDDADGGDDADPGMYKRKRDYDDDGIHKRKRERGSR